MRMARDAYTEFLAAFDKGQRVFGNTRLPAVIVRGNMDHVCTSDCSLFCINRAAAVFVCPRTLRPHYCGWGVCTAEYQVGAEGRVCRLTGNVVEGDASILSHGWREDAGRCGWDGAPAVAGQAVYDVVLRPGDSGFSKKRSTQKRKRVIANATEAGGGMAPPTGPGRPAIDKCIRSVRDLFPGSRVRAPHECLVRCTALTKAVGAVDRYVRSQRAKRLSVSLPKVSTLFRRHCARIPADPLVLPDDGTINLLSVGYSKVGIDFLLRLWTAAKIPPLPWDVALIALLYLQRRGVSISGKRVLGANALLRAWLPEANVVAQFSVEKGAFTAAKNTIQRVIRELESMHQPTVKLEQYTITQLLRIGARESTVQHNSVN